MTARDEKSEPARIATDVEEARRVVEAGGVLAYLTDTFYGLGANPFNREAVARINQLKGREGGKPILIIISDRDEALRFIQDQTKLFRKLAEKFWPGPLTIVVRAREGVPEEITAGSGTVGVRLPADEAVRALVRACGGALTATSANPAGQEPARSATEAANYFPHELDLIVNGGRSRTTRPSTVIDASTDSVRLIREGEVSRARLEQALRDFGEELKD